MQYRILGRTGLKVSVLGYGAGAVGGLLVRGSAAEQERSLARALEAGITYVDTAPVYGDGASETTLGRLLPAGRQGVSLGTKVRLKPEDMADPAPVIAASLEASLRRLGRDSVDLLQLHNPLTVAGGGNLISLPLLQERILPALRRLREQGKIRFFGITALGETAALRQVVRSGAIDTAQIPYNLLNPSAAGTLPPGLPGHDFGGLMNDCAECGVGVIGIRILAGGALSGEEERHPTAMPQVAPIASAASYAEDVANARRLLPLVNEGLAGSLAEAAIRFAITAPQMGTALIGTASIEQLEVAIAAAGKGPLPEAALKRIAALQGR